MIFNSWDAYRHMNCQNLHNQENLIHNLLRMSTSLYLDRFANTSPPILWMGVLLIHRRVSQARKQTALEVYLIMSHKETLAAFIGSEGVGKGRGAFPISRQSRRYQQPNLPHSYGSPETTQTPHFQNRSARLNEKAEKQKISQDFFLQPRHRKAAQHTTHTNTNTHAIYIKLQI